MATSEISTKHTPGPWVASVERSQCEGVNVTFGVSSPVHVSICSGQSQEHLGDGIMEVECRANAHLIAAAPELLAECIEAQAAASEACAQLFDLAERGDASYAVRDAKEAVLHLRASQHRLRAVIAKATGA